MKTRLLITFLGTLACYSCSNSYDLLENDLALAKASADYELTTRAISEETDTAKIETVADEQTIKALKDEYEQELMNRQSTAKEKVMRTAYAATTNVVGVFKVGSCGTYKELTLYIDAEDTKQSSKVEGNVGDSFVDGNGNPHFKFCLTEADRYYPGGVFLVDHINYDQLGNTMTVMVRYHDCDDKHTDNKVIESTHPVYKTATSISNGYTVVNNDAALAWAFPRFPIPQWSLIPPMGPKNAIKYGLLSGGLHAWNGKIHVDDEDSNNKNWLKRYIGYNFDIDMSARLYSDYGMNVGKNTDYYIALSTEKEFSYSRYYPNSGLPTPQP